MTRDVLIGIDPSIKTAGVAIMIAGSQRASLFQGDLLECLWFINKSGVLQRAVVVIEDPNLDSPAFGLWHKMKVAIQGVVSGRAPLNGTGNESAESFFRRCIKQAQHVGKNMGAAEIFQMTLQNSNVPFVSVAPSSRHRAVTESGEPRDVRFLNRPTKASAVQLKNWLKWPEQTDWGGEHSRDALTLIVNRTVKEVLNEARMKGQTETLFG